MMNILEQIEELLAEANSIGLKNELMELVKSVSEMNPDMEVLNIFEAAYNQLIAYYEN